MAPCFKRKGDYVVKEFIYIFKAIFFVPIERRSSHLLQTAGILDYIYSCCTANDVLRKYGAVDAKFLVPTCSVWDLFVQDQTIQK